MELNNANIAMLIIYAHNVISYHISYRLVIYVNLHNVCIYVQVCNIG